MSSNPVVSQIMGDQKTCTLAKVYESIDKIIGDQLGDLRGRVVKDETAQFKKMFNAGLVFASLGALIEVLTPILTLIVPHLQGHAMHISEELAFSTMGLAPLTGIGFCLLAKSGLNAPQNKDKVEHIVNKVIHNLEVQVEKYKSKCVKKKDDNLWDAEITLENLTLLSELIQKFGGTPKYQVWVRETDKEIDKEIEYTITAFGQTSPFTESEKVK